MIHVGDCIEVMRTLEANSFDSIVTDPPYHLTALSRKGSHRSNTPDNPYGRHRTGGEAARGFMGKTWDGGDVAFRPETWAEALRVAKPGAWLAAFGGTRTFHRLACAIEDAGWELRDNIPFVHEGVELDIPADCPWLAAWIYGSGFPKSHNGEWGGTALKPAWEPIVLARKPLEGTVEANWRKWGTGALNIDGCRIETTDHLGGGAYAEHGGRTVSPALSPTGMNRPGATAGEFVQPSGRWPANLIHDGSDEVVALFPREAGASAPVRGTEPSRPAKNAYGEFARGAGAFHGDTGSAARFFYCPKASRADRNDGLDDPGPQFKMGSRPCDYEAVEAAARGNNHPTVKPTLLMRWVCRLVTPAGGRILDMFCGSGSTGRGARIEGMEFVGIDNDPHSARIAEARVNAVQPGLALGHLL